MDDETLELAQVVQKWHAHRVEQINTVIDAPAETEVHLGVDEDAIVLKGEQLRGFRMGMVTALSMFRELPFSLEQND